MTENYLPRMLNKSVIILLYLLTSGCASLSPESSFEDWDNNWERVNVILNDSKQASLADALIEDYNRNVSNSSADSYSGSTSNREWFERNIAQWNYFIGYKLLQEKRYREAIQYLLRNNSPTMPLRDGGACDYISNIYVKRIPGFDLTAAIFTALDGAQDSRAGEWVHRAYYCKLRYPLAAASDQVSKAFNAEDYVSDVRKLKGEEESRQAQLYYDKVLRLFYPSLNNLVKDHLCWGCDSESDTVLTAKKAKLYENAVNEAHKLNLSPTIYKALELDQAAAVSSFKADVEAKAYREVACKNPDPLNAYCRDR